MCSVGIQMLYLLLLRALLLGAMPPLVCYAICTTTSKSGRRRHGRWLIMHKDFDRARLPALPMSLCCAIASRQTR